MTNTIRIKRRAAGGASGAPASLENAELAFNEQDDTLYYGKGTGGAGGTATSVEAIGGKGAFVSISVDQTILGNKVFSLPLGVAEPTTSGHAATKNYVDTKSISVTGDATGSGTSSIALTLANSGVTAGSYPKVTVDVKGRVTAGSTLLASDIPSLDAAKITTGTLTVPTSGNAGTASKLATARTISATGDATWTVTFDGSANITAALTLANSGATDGTYPKVTVNAKGIVTAGSALSATDIPTLTASKVSDFDTQVRNSRLDQMKAPTSSVNMGNQTLTNVATPVNDTDAANKSYVDLAKQGLNPKGSVKAASTANIAALSGVITIDGISLVAGDRVLLKNQTTASQNGIYVVSATAWARSDDASTWAELVSAYVFVEQGATNADNGFLITVDAGGSLGTTDITVVQFTGAGQVIAGSGLSKSGNTLTVGSGTGISASGTTVSLTGQALALHNLATNGLITRTAAGTVTARSVATSGSGLSISNGDGVAGNPTITLTAALSTVGGLTPAADRFAYYTGAAAASLATLTAFARTILDDADAATTRATLGLGNMATQSSAAVAITGGSIDGISIDGGTF